MIHSSPRSLVLTLSQLPYPGFIAENGAKNTGVISNKTAAGGETSLLHKFQSEDRQSSYVASFDREVSPQEVIGPVLIESSAVTYGSPSGATSGFTLQKHQLIATDWTQVSVGTLGQQAAAFTETKAVDSTEYQSFIVEWRQENVVDQIRIAGNAATLDISYALTLARVQQRHEVAK